MSKLTIAYTERATDAGIEDRMIITDEFGVVWFDEIAWTLSDLMPYELAYKILQGLGYEVEIL